MATTTPDSIRTPNPSDPYNLISDLGILANDTQAALNKRANSYVGTSTQRVAFSAAPEGVQWQDTNGAKQAWVRKAGAWTPSLPVASGSRTGISVTASTASTVTVTLPAGFFTTTPTVIISPNNPVAWNPQPSLRVLSRTATSFVVQIFSTAARTDIAFDWVAVQ